MTLTELNDGWYRYEESGGDIKIRPTEDGYEFGAGTAIVDHLVHEGQGGSGVGGLMERAIIDIEGLERV